MKQPTTEQTIDHTHDHRKPSSQGPDKLGETQASAQNVESDKAQSVEKGTDVDRVPSLDGSSPGTKTDTSRERSSERDEHGRL